MMKVLIRKEKIKELKNREKEVDKDVSIEWKSNEIWVEVKKL
jgi:hypothetical protein